jgi:hypothetical protein
MTRRRSARDRSKALGLAYDALRARGIPFYNDPIAGGRSLKPLVPVGPRLHAQLRKLADHTRVTPTIRSQHGSGMTGGDWRYHFRFTR